MQAPAPAAPAPDFDSPMLAFIARHPRAVILTCFFLSGATGLIYEVVWSRRLTLVFGATVLAVSTVLAAFLGGLALGSLIFGRLADRRRDPLRLYALLEAGVGLICLLTPLLFIAVEKTYLAIHPLLADHLLLLRLVRFVLAGLVLLAPTILMGGTLPVLSRAVVQRSGEIGQRVAGLYGLNTLGAVFGALAAGFLFIPGAGISGTIYMAAVLNLAIAAVAYAVHMTGRIQAADPEADASPPAAVSDRRAHAFLLIAYALSGAAALIYEVGWTRVLSASFGTTTYAFSAMLGAFLAGIAIGSIVLTSPRLIRIDNLRAPLLWFGAIEIGIGLSVTLLTPLLDRMPLVFLSLYRTLGPHFMVLQFASLVVAMLVMLLPAGLMGLAFPLVARIATDRLGLLGRRLSGVYAANTAGTVVGSFAAGFVLIPWLGVRHALLVGVALNVLVGLAYTFSARRDRPVLAHAGLILGVLALLSWLVLPDWNKHVLSSGAYVYPTFYLGGDARKAMQEKELLHYRDALTAMISVTKVSMPGMDKPLISLQINGKTDASTGDLSTQLLLAHLPALLHPKPERALVIGLASGCTLGALELHPEVKEIDCVEIEPEMARVTGFFRDLNHDCLRDPRVRLTFDDGRNFALVTKRRYDLITSEPSNPWIAGIANLFTREFFTLCRARLNDGGVYCQWLPIYNLSLSDLRCVVTTFQSVFPDCSLWMFTDLMSDAYLIGTKGPLRLQADDIVRRMKQPQIAHDLASAGVRDPWHFLAGYTFEPRALAELCKGASLNTDDHPVLEFSAPLALYSGVSRQTMLEVLGAARQSVLTLAQPNGDRSPLLGLSFGPPWRLDRGPQVFVRRDASQLVAGQGPLSLRIEAQLDTELGKGRAQVLIRPAAHDEPPARGGGEVLLPPVQMADHRATVWRLRDSESAWHAQWFCPRNGLIYEVTARSDVAVSAETALRAINCRP